MKSSEMEELIFGSTPDPHDRDGCLDDAPERRVRATRAWPHYLAGNPPPSELVSLLKRLDLELLALTAGDLEATQAYLDMIGSGIEHLVSRADALENDIHAVLDLIEHLDGEEGERRQVRIRHLLEGRPPQLALL